MSNCLFFALALYLRRCKAKEGYLVWRFSRWGVFPHVLYAERRASGSLRVVSYVPINPRFKHCPPPIFTGRAKWGDN